MVTDNVREFPQKNKTKDQDGEAKAAKETIATQMLGLLKKIIHEYWHTPEREPFVTITRAGNIQSNVKVRSEAFTELAGLLYYSTFEKSINDEAVKTAISTIAAISKHHKSSQQYEVYTRVGHTDDAIWVDLGTDDYSAIRIDAEGWKVVPSDQVGVKFYRNMGSLPLCPPVPGGNINELRTMFNDIKDEDWAIFCGFVAGIFQKNGGRAFLEILGGKGSGKSTLMEYMVMLIHPSNMPYRSLPSNPDDLAIAGEDVSILALDNVSSITNEISDLLCQMATGMGIGKRKLYTDSDEHTIKVHVPICWTCISSQGTSRSDLRDRVLTMYVPKMPDTGRQTRQEMDRVFDEMRPRLQGAIYDMVSIAMRNAPNVKIKRLPRLADFAVWAEAAAPAFGLEEGFFVDAMKRSQEHADELTLEGSMVSPLLIKLMQAGYETRTFTAQGLYETIRDDAKDYIRNSKYFPGSASKLREHLNTLAQPLANIGIVVDFQRKRIDGEKNASRMITITRVEPLFTEKNSENV